MKPRSIEKRYSLAANLLIALLLLIPAFMLTGFLQGSQTGSGDWPIKVFFGFGVVAFVGLTLYRIRVTRQLKRHSAELEQWAQSHGWSYTLPGSVLAVAPLRDLSITMLAEDETDVLDMVDAGTWQYIDWSYVRYGHSKGGRYKAADIYYGIAVTELSRIMPNVFFDSITDKGRQFKAKFAADQKHSLEGNFDTYFDTYFAEGYTIDSMSFITPDVMEALIAASAYDIEIVDNRLVLYGPMYQDTAAIEDMVRHMQAIRAELEQNIKTYRDNRLLGSAGQYTVTPQGMRLTRRGVNKWVLVGTVAAYGAYVIIQAIIRNKQGG